MTFQLDLQKEPPEASAKGRAFQAEGEQLHHVPGAERKLGKQEWVYPVYNVRWGME